MIFTDDIALQWQLHNNIREERIHWESLLSMRKFFPKINRSSQEKEKENRDRWVSIGFDSFSTKRKFFVPRLNDTRRNGVKNLWHPTKMSLNWFFLIYHLLVTTIATKSLSIKIVSVTFLERLENINEWIRIFRFFLSLWFSIFIIVITRIKSMNPYFCHRSKPPLLFHLNHNHHCVASASRFSIH